MSAQPIRRRPAAAPSGEPIFDADAARAARLEAAGDPFTFHWDGATFTALPAKEWPIAVTGMLAEGRLVDALRLILGDDFDPYMRGNPTMGDVEALMGAMARRQGLTLPQ